MPDIGSPDQILEEGQKKEVEAYKDQAFVVIKTAKVLADRDEYGKLKLLADAANAISAGIPITIGAPETNGTEQKVIKAYLPDGTQEFGTAFKTEDDARSYGYQIQIDPATGETIAVKVVQELMPSEDEIEVKIVDHNHKPVSPAETTTVGEAKALGWEILPASGTPKFAVKPKDHRFRPRGPKGK